MSEISKKIPNQTEVRQIFHEAYNVFYKKWKDISSPEQWGDLMKDMHEIDGRYQCDLCRQILLELVKVIENEFKSKEGSK
jgi:hypothetical protein